MLRNLHVLEGEAAGRDAHTAHILEQSGGEAGGVLLDRADEGGDPSVFGLSVLVHEGGGEVAAFHEADGLFDAADVDLLPVDDVFVTSPRDLGAHGTNDVAAALPALWWRSRRSIRPCRPLGGSLGRPPRCHVLRRRSPKTLPLDRRRGSLC